MASHHVTNADGSTSGGAGYPRVTRFEISTNDVDGGLSQSLQFLVGTRPFFGARCMPFDLP